MNTVVYFFMAERECIECGLTLTINKKKLDLINQKKTFNFLKKK